MKHFSVTAADTADLAMGNSKTITRDDGTVLHLDANDEYTREAAIENVFKVGSYGQIIKVIESTGQGGVNYAHRSTVLDSLIESGKTNLCHSLMTKPLT